MGLVLEIAYVVIAATDVDAWVRFATAVLGLDAAPGPGASVYLRYDGRAARIIVEHGTTDDVAAVGLRVSGEASVAELSARGALWDEQPERAAARGVARLWLGHDPAGVPVELVVDPAEGATPLPGFVAGDLGFGHVVLATRDKLESERFWVDVMGAKVSDRIVTTFYKHQVSLVFLHFNRRHHSIALGGPLPRRAHHLMIERATVDDVGEVLDRAVAAGVPIVNLPGRHPNDRMWSFYCVAPGGLQVEVGCEGVEVAEDHVPTTYDRISLWGHHPPAAVAPRRGAALPPAVRPYDVPVDGGHLRVTEVGEGVPVVLLHGSGPGASGPSNFLATATALAERGYRCFMLDLLGYGASSKPVDRPYTLSRHLEAVGQALPSLVADGAVHVIGNSMGGAVAMLLAMEHPARVRKLVLMAPGGLETTDVYMGMRGIRRMAKALYGPDGLDRDGLARVLELQVHDGVVDAAVLDDRWGVAKEQPLYVHRTLAVPDLSQRLGEIRCPTLVFWGREDAFCPVSGAQRLQAGVADARVVVVPRCGHWVMVERPKLFRRWTVDFLADAVE